MVRAVKQAAWHPWRDACFWRKAAAHVAAIPPGQLASRDLAQVCLAFRRIDYSSNVLADYCKTYVGERLQHLNMFELAAVLLYFATEYAGTPGSQDFVRKVADEACIEWRQRENVPWSAWRMLVCSAALAGVAHQQLFVTASPHLVQSVKLMSGRDAVDVCNAYATFRFKHHGLFTEVARFLPNMGLNDREVAQLQAAFQRLEFDAPLLKRIQELRSYAAQAKASWE
mmetsp:Transcript_112571/g.352061  ORF Transcript_112571/g.352061 Transcript_112571/m.352061 type:complete len:227 (+) Transcript_112571:110-790(+)